MAQRDDARTGTARGLRLPGILPEPGVIESDGDDLTVKDQAILADLAWALPAEDREATDDAQAPAKSNRLERPRAQVPWWLGSLFFTAAGLASVGAAAMDGPVWRRILFLAVGIVFFRLAWQSWRNRLVPAG